MKTSTVVLLLVLFGAGLSSAAAFWPVCVDATYLYENESGEFLEITFSPNGTVVSRYFGYVVSRVTESYVEDTEGNVFLTDSSLYYEGAIDPEYWYHFDPGLQVIHAPMAVGDSWVAFSVGLGGYSPYCVTTWEFEVVSQGEISVPAGTYSALEVAFTSQSCLQYPQSGTWYLNAELGPIVVPGGFKLVSYTNPVGVEQVQWGGVKALFR